MTNRTRLKFSGVSEIVSMSDLGLLTLTDETHERQITIVCEQAMAVQLELRAKQVPITDILLPEVLCKVLKQQANLNLEIYINDIIDGQYRTHVINKDTMDFIPIRASDAVLMSVAGNIPIFIDTRLMMRQSVRYCANSHGVSLPVNTLNNEMLDAALAQAVKDENYELASQLRDEKQRRSKDSGKERL